VRARAIDFNSRTSLLVQPRRFARFLGTGISDTELNGSLTLSLFMVLKQEQASISENLLYASSSEFHLTRAGSCSSLTQDEQDRADALGTRI
jgi:uncharacterized membrane protein